MNSSKRRGRPPLDPTGPSVNVHLRLTSKHYDALAARADRARESLPEMIRRALVQNLGDRNRRDA